LDPEMSVRESRMRLGALLASLGILTAAAGALLVVPLAAELAFEAIRRNDSAAEVRVCPAAAEGSGRAAVIDCGCVDDPKRGRRLTCTGAS